MSFDIINSCQDLFARFNRTCSDNGPEVLDSEEIKLANKAGFSIFTLKENMTEDEFFDEYLKCAPSDEEGTEAKQFEKIVNDVQITYLKMLYNSDEDIREGESIDAFGHRLSAMDAIKSNEYSDEDRKMFALAINNPDDIDAVLEANSYFNDIEPDSPVWQCMGDLMGKYQAAMEEFLETVDENDRDIIDQVIGGDVYNAGEGAKSYIEKALAVLNKYPQNDGSKHVKFNIMNLAKELGLQ